MRRTAIVRCASAVATACAVLIAAPVAQAAPSGSYAITETAPDATTRPLTPGSTVSVHIAPQSSAPSPFSQNARLFEGPTELGTAFIDSGLNAAFSVTGGVGTHVYSVHFDNDTSSSITRTFSKGTVDVGLGLASSMGGMSVLQYSKPTPPPAGVIQPPVASGTYDIVQDGGTVLTSVAAANGSVTLPTADLTNHYVTARYSGDSNYETAESAPVTSAPYLPVSVSFRNPKFEFVGGYPQVTVDVNAGPLTKYIASNLNVVVDGLAASGGSVVVASNGTATASFTSVQPGLHTYAVSTDVNRLFLGGSATTSISFGPYPAAITISNVSDVSNRHLYVVHASIDVVGNPPLSQPIQAYVNAYVDDQFNGDTYISCGSQHCTQVFNVDVSALGAGTHRISLVHPGIAFNEYYSIAPATYDFTLDDIAPYRIVTANGKVATEGNESSRGQLSSAPNQPIVGSASTPSGHGYWLVASDGGIFSFGDAAFHGSMGGSHLNKPIVGMSATKSGEGYWLVASDGGIFSFGDAQFYGSMGGSHLNKPIVGMTTTVTGAGYWFVASDGGIFSFGDAQFYGSTGAITLNQPIVGMAPTSTGRGYWFVASDGGVFSYGDAQFYGSAGGIQQSKPIVAMKATADARGYWFITSDGGVFAYGDAVFLGSPATPAGDRVVTVV